MRDQKKNIRGNFHMVLGLLWLLGNRFWPRKSCTETPVIFSLSYRINQHIDWITQTMHTDLPAVRRHRVTEPHLKQLVAEFTQVAKQRGDVSKQEHLSDEPRQEEKCGRRHSCRRHKCFLWKERIKGLRWHQSDDAEGGDLINWFGVLHGSTSV